MRPRMCVFAILITDAISKWPQRPNATHMIKHSHTDACAMNGYFQHCPLVAVKYNDIAYLVVVIMYTYVYFCLLMKPDLSCILFRYLIICVAFFVNYDVCQTH